MKLPPLCKYDGNSSDLAHDVLEKVYGCSIMIPDAQLESLARAIENVIQYWAEHNDYIDLLP